MKIRGAFVRKALTTIFVVLFTHISKCGIWTQEIFISNLDPFCMRCLCYAASSCNTKTGCDEGHCGPFQLGHSYWIDAGRPSLLRDDPYSLRAFQNCALTFPCAQGAVKYYLAKYGKDCNGDKVTNCDDFALINFNGAFDCNRSIEFDRVGREYWQRYQECVRIKI